MRARRWAAVGVLAAALTSVAPADAATPVVAGYWWVGEAGTVSVPPPTQVPAKGLYVASNASGPTAVSAIRFTLAIDQTNPQLTLRVHQLQQGDTFAVDAYPTRTKWSPGSAQPWSSKPSYDPKAAPVHGVLSADGKTVTFALAAIVPGHTADLVLVPGAATPAAAGAPSPPSPTFDAAFEAPDRSSVVTTQVQPAAPVPTPEASYPAGPSGPTFAAPPAPLTPLLPPAPGIVTPPLSAPSVAPQLPVLTQQPVRSANTVVTRRVGRSTRDTAILVFLLADVMFYLGWLARAQTSSTSGRVSIYDLPVAEGT
jgi:hypothetical protein